MGAEINGDRDGFSTEEFEDIQLCIETLLSVRAGSQPMDRDFGIDFDEALDYPQSVAQNALSVEIIDKINRYEPRVEVESVTFTFGKDGQMIPHVYFVRNEDYEEDIEETEEEDEEY